MKHSRLISNYNQPPKFYRKLCMICLCLFFVHYLSAQTNYTISGKVNDPVGSGPIVGAVVNVENTNFATTTDLEGNYRLSANLSPGEYKIVIRSVGYTTSSQAISLGSQTELTLDVSLEEDIMKMDEIVITGSGINASRKQLGNFIATIEATDIQNIASNNPLATLSGRVLGAQVTQNSGDPAGGFSVRLRGVSTINGSSEPLYIVDGVIVDNSSQNVINLNADAQGTNFSAGQNRLVDINPNDIERIEVLNGSAAAAIYGSLASNGVVQIFTKRGRDGKIKVTVSTSLSVSELRKRLEFNKLGKRFGYPGDARLSTVGDRLTMIADLRPVRVPAGTGPVALGGALVNETYDVTRYDYQDNLFQTALGTDNYVSVTGGNERSSFLASASYSNNEGIVRNTNFQKYGVRFRLDQRLSNWIKFSTGLVYNNSLSQDLPNGNNFFSPVSTMIIIDNVWDITERDAFGRLLHVEQQRVNPLSVIEEFKISQETNRFIGDIKTSLFLFKALNIDYTIGLDTYSLLGNTFQPRLPYGPVAATFFPDGYASVATSNVYKINHDWIATYQANITSQFVSTTTAGAQLIYDKRRSSAAEGRDLLDFVQTIAAAKNYFTPAREARSEFSVWGYFLQQTFGYNDLLFVTLAGRFDGSSVFGKDERNQFYPKVSGSFVVSQLDFWKNSSLANFINTLKLRASYGEAGNLTAIGAYDRFTNANPVILTGRGGFLPDAQLGETNIKPERKKELELGFDMSLLKSRLGIQFNYYNQNIEDLILPVTLAPSSGGQSIITNIGTMENKGFELMLSGSPVRTSDFKWDVSWLFSYYENEVKNIANSTRAGLSLRGGGGTQSAISGYPLGVFYAVFYARNEDGSLLLNPLGLPQVERGNDLTGEYLRDGNGQPTGTPVRQVLGDPFPDYNSSLINEFTYKKFNLRVQFDAMGGFDVYNWNKITSNNVGASPLSERELRGELPRGWVAAIGGFIGPRIQEEHVEKGDFVKLREIAFTYNLGKLRGFENLSLSLIGRNLFSFDDYTGYDPETNSAGQSTRVRGDDFGNVPIPRTYQLKITASF